MGRKRKCASLDERAAVRGAQGTRRYRARNVDIGDQRDRWAQLASEAGCASDAEFAQLLIDRFTRDDGDNAPRRSGRNAPTEMVEAGNTGSDHDETLPSGISDAEDASDEEGARGLSIPDKTLGPRGLPMDRTHRASNPPLIDYTMSRKANEPGYNMADIPEESPVDLVHPLPLLTERDAHMDLTTHAPVVSGARAGLAEEPCIAYLSSLQDLAPQVVKCHKCQRSCRRDVEWLGSAVILVWQCKLHGTIRRWCSQPRMKSQDLNLGDFMLAMNTLLSGNNYNKIALLFRFMGMGLIGPTQFADIQRLYCIPGIERYWSEHRKQTVDALRGTPLVIAGAGHGDRPGHYVIMEHASHRILALEVVDENEVEAKSPNMAERDAADRALRLLMGAGLLISEFVTDAHVQISALMKQPDFSAILHQYDTWQGARNLAKKLHAAADQKGNEALKAWIPDIVNHFWHCTSKAQGSHAQFVGRWRGILHCVTNKHWWIDGILTDPACEHGPLDAPPGGQAWLEAGSPAHRALGWVATYKPFLRRVPHYTNCRQTAALDIFHQHLLMYAPKSFAFSPPVYAALNKLAALDFNLHLDLPVQKDADGNVIYRRLYNKRTDNWIVVPLREPKNYLYIPDLQACIWPV